MKNVTIFLTIIGLLTGCNWDSTYKLRGPERGTVHVKCASELVCPTQEEAYEELIRASLKWDNVGYEWDRQVWSNGSWNNQTVTGVIDYWDRVDGTEIMFLERGFSDPYAETDGRTWNGEVIEIFVSDRSDWKEVLQWEISLVVMHGIAYGEANKVRFYQTHIEGDKDE